MVVVIDRRANPTIRSDINDAVRDDFGRLSPEKIGCIVGQFISAKYLLVHWEKIITNWDVLSVLFAVLIAPTLAKRLISMKYGVTPDTTTTTATAAVVTTTAAADARSTAPKIRGSGKSR